MEEVAVDLKARVPGVHNGSFEPSHKRLLHRLFLDCKYKAKGWNDLPDACKTCATKRWQCIECAYAAGNCTRCYTGRMTWLPLFLARWRNRCGRCKNNPELVTVESKLGGS